MIEIRKSFWRPGWQWSCPVCHYGANIPWEEVPTHADAIDAVSAHLASHRAKGMRSEWAPLRLGPRA